MMARLVRLCRRCHRRVAIHLLVVALGMSIAGCGGGESGTTSETVPAGVKSMQDFVKEKGPLGRGTQPKAKSRAPAAK
jgi:hypothetical protein